MVLDRIYQRLWQVLTGVDKTQLSARLTEEDRKAIYEILLDTKPELPAYWRARESTTR